MKNKYFLILVLPVLIILTNCIVNKNTTKITVQKESINSTEKVQVYLGTWQTTDVYVLSFLTGDPSIPRMEGSSIYGNAGDVFTFEVNTRRHQLKRYLENCMDSDLNKDNKLDLKDLALIQR